jgi:hypothetical protein
MRNTDAFRQIGAQRQAKPENAVESTKLIGSGLMVMTGMKAKLHVRR